MIRNLIQLLRRSTHVSPLSFLLLMSSSMALAGEIHKCVDAQGKVSYSDKPCLSTETSATIPNVHNPTVDLQWPAPLVTSRLQQECIAARQAMRDKTVPLSELENLKNRIRLCLYLEIKELERETQAARKADAEKRQAELARMSPECQALWKEVSTLQTTIESPDEINHYINRSELYQRSCVK